MFRYDASDRERFADEAPEEAPPPARAAYAGRVAANGSPRGARRRERRRLARLWRAWLARRDAGQDPGPLPPFPAFARREA